MSARRCSSCGGNCLWAEDAWTCTACGNEWNEQHSLRFAPPWSDEDERRVAELRATRTFDAEYKRLRQLETLEAARRRQKVAAMRER